MALKSKTQTKTNAVNAITLTSPDKKKIFLKGYLVASYGAAALTTDLTIQITDEDSNVLWEDAISQVATGQPRARFIFPGLGLPVMPKKNVTVTVAAGAANESTELSVLYNI